MHPIANGADTGVHPTKIYLGTQGWSYRDWVGSFYPPGTQPRDYLRHYAAQFDAVEIDSTFYGPPRPQMVSSWRETTPKDFQFCPKVPRSITHERRLTDVGAELQEFLHAIEPLETKLGVILIQLPPDFTIDECPALEGFLRALPPSLRFAAEFRHPSWLNADAFDLLRKHNIAWTNIDLVYMPQHVEVTATHSYFRWLGERSAIKRVHASQIERRPDLRGWAEKLDEVAQQVQRVYGFANNHYSGHSPSDVRFLRECLLLPAPDVPPTPIQDVLL